MPKIYEYFGLTFFFYSNEHIPIHVHVQYGEYENKVEFVYENGKLINILFKKKRGVEQLPAAKQKEVSTFINHFHNQIVDKWTEFFILKKQIKNEKISKKL